MTGEPFKGNFQNCDGRRGNTSKDQYLHESARCSAERLRLYRCGQPWRSSASMNALARPHSGGFSYPWDDMFVLCRSVTQGDFPHGRWSSRGIHLDGGQILRSRGLPSMGACERSSERRESSSKSSRSIRNWGTVRWRRPEVTGHTPKRAS
jgi:hypothetical protein